MPKFVLVALAIPFVAAASMATAQSRSDRLAEQWREAKRTELLKERDVARAALALQEAKIDTALQQIDSNATPDTDVAASDTAATKTTVATTTKVTSPTGSTEKTTVATSESGQSDSTKAARTGLGDFAGLKFGVGLSFTIDTGDNDRVSEASLVNGLVRVDDENNARARIMLESHYFFTPQSPIFGLKEDHWGFGPFVSLQPGSDNIIEAIGMGVMVGFRRGETNDSFNLGFGMVVDPNTRILGDGIVANQPLPTGETAVRYKERMQRGVLILSSFSF